MTDVIDHYNLLDNHYQSAERIIHKYDTRNRDEMRSACGKHEFMYSNFRFVGIHICNYILHHLNVNVTLPKFKKNI